MDYITVNPVELATKLAEAKLAEQYDDQDSYIEQKEGDEYGYTEDAQKIFDQYYDEFYEIITESGI